MNPLAPLAPRLTWLTGAFIVALSALVVSVGADAQWLAALGSQIATLGDIPSGIPYAAAPSAGWENVPVLGELIFHALEAGLPDRGLVLAQLAAVALAVSLLALDMRRADVPDAPSALVLLLTAVAAAGSLLVVRGQLFSIALFPVLLVLLRSQARLPTDAVWLLVPLVAVWSNLHGAVLTGVAVAAAYLVLHRLRRQPLVAVTVLLCCIGALLLTPALLHTGDYYRGVLGSEAVAGREAMWAPLSLSKPFDVAFVLAGVPLVLAALASRPRAWEFAALAGLAGMTVQSGRNGVWLVMFAATPAARWLTGSRDWRLRLSRPLTFGIACALGAVLALGLARTPPAQGAGDPLRAQAARVAAGKPILADALNAEALALDGSRVVIANPLDAFARPYQRLYLDFLEGRPSGDALLRFSPAVLVNSGSPPARRMAGRAGWRRVSRDANAVLYVHVSG